ncbi:sigma-54-dependent Fis family transcriptional regulator [bacterium]|nr:sigma-54-dependent Fis family transcriptional regulator [bacterium]
MRSSRILIVDDDLSILQILKKILINEGYDVESEMTGKAGVEQFRKIDYDLVLLDIRLPDMMPDKDGIDVARTFLNEKPGIPIILITAHGSVDQAVSATKFGIYDFIEKPFERERLLLNIRNALSWRSVHADFLRARVEAMSGYKMIGQSDAMCRVYGLIDRVAPLNSPVLIIGPSGTGKELVAQAVHAKSSRSGRRMIKVNCAAIHESLIESELFGHVKGSFTGAVTNKEGRVQSAHRSTLFLDEIGDLSQAAQAKILRFLENGEVQKVGAVEIQRVDVRVISATNKPLWDLVKARRFREDLYYRLEVFTIETPVLAGQYDDIPILLEHFFNYFSDKMGIPRPSLTRSATYFLKQHPWPGNVRQLRNFVERAIIFHGGASMDLEHCKRLAPVSMKLTDVIKTKTLREARIDFEIKHISETLNCVDGNIAEAARLLGMDRGNLHRKMTGLGLNVDEI